MAVVKNSGEVEEGATALEPNRILRELIGKDTKLEEVFTRERIEAGQKTLDDARSAFFDHAREELAQLEVLVKKNETAPDQCEAVFEDMAVHAGNLKGHAEMFGFTLVAAVCGHIADTCDQGGRTPAARIRLASDLVRMLGIAIREKITDESGVVGRELRTSLGKY